MAAPSPGLNTQQPSPSQPSSQQPSSQQPSQPAAAVTLASQSSLTSSSSLTVWTREQDKQFENALNVYYDQDTPNRWENVASMVPGKDAAQVKRHFEILQEDIGSIDAGRVALPNYSLSSLSISEDGQAAASDSPGGGGGKKGAGASYPGQASGSGTNVNGNGSAAVGKGMSSKSADQERRKGIPWSEEEHRSEFPSFSLSVLNEAVVLSTESLCHINNVGHPSVWWFLRDFGDTYLVCKCPHRNPDIVFFSCLDRHILKSRLFYLRCP